MAQNSVNVRLVLRHDSSAKWATENPVLLSGEAGVEIDSGLIKIGDGTKTWNELSYVNDASMALASHYEGIANAEETDNAAITRILGENVAKKDDICIVKRLISGDKYSYTGYVYNGTAWAALDGNVSSENVYFSEDLIATAPVGTVTIPPSGSATIAAAGKNVKQVLSSILAQEKNPTITPPEISISLTSAGAKEVGSKFTPAYTTKFTKGSYTYGPDTGITALTYSISDGTNTRDTATGTFDEITVGDSTSYKLTATVTYGDGTIPKTNLGNDYAAGQIKAGSKTSGASAAISGYRSFFYGAVANTDAIDSALIRGLTNGGAYGAKKTLTVKAEDVSGAKRIIVAYPANSTRGGLTEVLLTSTMNLDITSSYVQQANVNVEGLNSYTAVPYKVFVYQPDALGKDEVHQITLA